MSKTIKVLCFKTGWMGGIVGLMIERSFSTVELDSEKFLEFAQSFVGGQVDVARLEIEGKHVDAWVNDEGLYVEDNPVHSVGSAEGLAGSMIFTTCDDVGNTCSANVDEWEVRKTLKLIGITRG